MGMTDKEAQVQLGALRFRINMGMRKINERQAEVDSTPPGEYWLKLCAKVEKALPRLEELLCEYEELAGHPFWCPGTGCASCDRWGKKQCLG